jgi:death-on-curing family protein
MKNRVTWMPTSLTVERIHKELTEEFSNGEDPISPPGVKNFGMLESACSRPITAFGNEEKYKDVFQKTAALFHSLTKNHPFHNGNKRTAVVTAITCLSRNDLRLAQHVDDEAIFDLVVRVTSNRFPNNDHNLELDSVIEQIAKWLRESTVRVSGNMKPILLSELISACKKAGGQVTSLKGGSTKILGTSGSVRIGKSRTLEWKVARNYLQKLGYTQSQNGLDFSEVIGGVRSEREQIYRYLSALRKLAKT